MPSLTEQSKELRQKRAKLITDARAILDKADEEKRDLTEEENQQWDKMTHDADEMRKKYERLERQAELEADVNQPQNEPVHTRNQPTNPDDNQPTREERQMAAFRRILPAFMSQDYRDIPADELRALQSDLDVSGGYLRPPEQFVNQLIKAVDDQTYIRQWATTITVTNADSLGVPTH